VSPHDDRSEIVETVTRVSVLADRREWDALPALFTPKVTVDYSSLSGGEPAVVDPVGLVEGWKATLSPLGVTQHLVGNHLVTIDGDESVVTCAFQATHVGAPPDGDRRWVLGGDYRYTLVKGPDGWRISGITMTARWETGDRSLVF
jgi:hypothetical protein